MARPVDEKIVSLKLENADFESKARQSLTTFTEMNDRFDKALDIDNRKALESLKGINDEAGKIDLRVLQEALEATTSRLSTFGIMAKAVLEDIAMRLFDFGVSFANTFTFGPMMEGMQEYELKLNSMKMIMMNTGQQHTYDEISKALDILNVYADKTIYNFGQMTRYVGLFTTAGTSLYDSISAIQGIGNLSAVVGATAEQNERAMYAMSMAMSQGHVALYQWRSLQSAGLGGKLFQDMLLDTAEELGQAVDRSEDFRLSLRKGWLTSEVLLATLKKIGEDDVFTKAATEVHNFRQFFETVTEIMGTGWAETWELVIGNFDVAGERLTALSEKINAHTDMLHDNRNEYVKYLADANVFEKAFEVIMKGTDMVFSWTDGIRAIWAELFPRKKAEDYHKILNTILDVIDRMTLGSRKAGPVVKGLQAIVDMAITTFAIFWEIAKQVASALMELFPGHLVERASNFLNEIKKHPRAFLDYLRDGEPVKDLVLRMADSFKEAWAKAKEFFGGFTQYLPDFSGLWEDVSFKMASFWSDVKEGKVTLKDLKDLVIDFGKGILEWVNPALEKLSEVTGVAWDGLKKMGGEITFGRVWKGLNFALMLNMLKKIRDVVEVLMGKGAIGLLEGKSTILKRIGDALFQFSKTMKAIGQFTRAKALMELAKALMVLVGAIVVLSLVPVDKLAVGVITLGIVTTGLVILLDQLSKMKKIDKSIIGSLITLTLALGILSGAVALLGFLKPETVMQGSLAVGALMTMLALFSISMQGIKISTKTVATLTLLAGAIILLTGPIIALGMINTDTLIQGLLALTAAMTIIGVFAKAAEYIKPSGMITFGLAMIELSIAIGILTGIVYLLGSMDLAVLTQGGEALVIFMSSFVIFGIMTRLVKPANILAFSTSMLILSGALLVMMGPLAAFALMDLGSIGKSLLMLGGVMAVFGVSSKLLTLKDAATMAGIAISMGLLAGGIMLLIPALHLLQTLDIKKLALGLITLGIAIGGMALIGGIISPLIGPMFLMAGAMLALGTAAALIAGGMWIFTEAIRKMGEIGGPALATVGGAISDLLSVLWSKAGEFASVAWEFISNFVRGLVERGPEMIDAGLQLIEDLILGILGKIERFWEIGIAIIAAIGTGLIEAMDDLVTLGVLLIGKFINSLANGIRDNGQMLLTAGWNLVTALLGLIVDALEMVLNSILPWDIDLRSKLGMAARGSTDAFEEEFGVDEKANEILDRLKSKVTDNTPEVEDLVGTMAGGATAKFETELDLEGVSEDEIKNMLSVFYDNKDNAWSAGKSLSTSARDGSADVSFYGSGENAVSGFVSGISNNLWRAASSGRAVATTALSSLRGAMSEQSPSRETMKSGLNAVLGFVMGMDNNSDLAARSASRLAQGALTAIQDYRDMFMSILAEELEYSPVIRPVLDMDSMDLNTYRGLWDADAINMSIGQTNLDVNDAQVRMFGAREPSGESVQNGYNLSVVNNIDMADAKFIIREDADIDKIAKALDERTTASMTKKGLRVIPV